MHGCGKQTRAAIFGTPWWAHDLMGPMGLEIKPTDCIWYSLRSSTVLQSCITFHPVGRRWANLRTRGIGEFTLLHQSFPGCRYADVTVQKHVRNLPLQQHQANFGQRAAQPVDRPGMEVGVPSAVTALQNITECHMTRKSSPMEEK